MTKLCYLIPLLVLGAAPLHAAEPADMKSRVERLERLLESQSLVEMLTRIDSQQREMAQLRGEVETLRHEIEGLKQRQRDLYLDTDRRLLRLEREGVQADGPETSRPVETDVKETSAGAEAAAPVADNVAQLAAERQAYEKAFDILRELQYEQAIEAFEAFLKQYPQGRYAHIAQYWLGEANYARRDFEKAIAAYRALVDNHPKSPKRAEALLKIGYSYHELGQDEKARPVLEQLIEAHPGTTEAGQANGLLKQMGRKAG